jgi:hypothetical protein
MSAHDALRPVPKFLIPHAFFITRRRGFAGRGAYRNGDTATGRFLPRKAGSFMNHRFKMMAEPSIEELLEDTGIRLLMLRDGVEEAELRYLLKRSGMYRRSRR